MVAISAGNSHNLALKSSGTVVAWGSNSSGQTNVPAALSNVVAIAAGGSHSLALKADGTVLAWGGNLNGQADVPAGLSNVVAIAGGSAHSLALKHDGSVVAWGSTNYGLTAIPTDLSRAAAIAAGSAHNLVLSADGTVVGWGYNNYGQTNTPPGLSGVTAISGGQGDSLALIGNGAPWFSPVVPARQVLGGSTVSLRAPVSGEVPLTLQWQLNGTNLPGTTNLFVTLTNLQMGQAGSYRLAATNAWGGAVSAEMALVVLPFRILTHPQPRMALLRGDATFSVQLDGQGPFTNQWLFNGNPLPLGTNAALMLTNIQWTDAGQYSVRVSNRHGTITSAEASLTVTPVAAWGWGGSGETNVPARLSNLVLVASGNSHSLALKRDGTVTAWGRYEYGQDPVQAPPGLSNVVGIAAGNSFSAALRSNGTVVVWSDYSTPATNLPAGLTNIVSISAGYDKAMALKADGTVVTWGTSAAIPEGIGQIVQIASGGSHFLALLSEGTVVAWGDNAYGQTNVPPWLSNVIAVAGSQYHSIAATRWTDAGRYSVIVSNTFGSVTSAGAELGVIPVVAWGDGDYVTTAPKNLTNAIAMSAGGGRVVAARRNGTIAAWDASGSYGWLTNIPTAWSNTVAVASGNSHCLALQSNGTVVGWAHPNNGTIWGQASPPVGLDDVVAISAGGDHSMALKEDGHIVTWGSDYYGQSRMPPGLDRVVAIADGGYHSLALRDNGRVVAWGYDGSGQASVPADLTDVIAIAAGDNQSLAIQADGRIVLWGHNAQGQMNVPLWLSNVVGVASGYMHCLALRADGNTVVWGNGANGQTNAPAWLGSNFVSVASASYLNAALEGNGPPFVPPVVRSRIGVQGLTTRFYVPTTGGLPLAYQWQFKGTNLPGATSALLSLTNLAPGQAGNYQLIVSNAWGTATSSDINLSIEPLRITWPPQNTNTHLSGIIALNATVEGKDLAYQWLFNGLPLDGQTNATLILAGLDWSNEGNYSLRISNSYGTATSAAAAVRLSPLVVPFDDANLQTNLPSGLRDIVAVTTGGDCFLALRSNRTVLAWGDNTYGQTNVPPGLNNVVAVAASWAHCLALRADGTVVAWGRNDSGQTNVPPGLGNVVAIAAGSHHSLALRADGTVVAWGAGAVGGQSDVPVGLNNVVAIAAGNFSLALKADGTAVAWGTYWNGDGGYPPMFVPTDLTDAVAIGTGTDHCLAVRSDGRVFAWGNSWNYRTLVPADLTNAVAVAGGYFNSLALRSDSTVIAWGRNSYSPMLAPDVTNVVALAEGGWVGLIGDGAPYLSPAVTNRSGPAGSMLHLNLRATGRRPMSYQWFLNGSALPGATDSLLSLRGLNPHQTGSYSLRATNALGSANVSNLNVRLDGLWLGVQPNPDPAQFNLGVFGPSGSRCALLVSSNLVDWAELRRLTNSGQIQIITESKAGKSHRFYRLKTY